MNLSDDKRLFPRVSISLRIHIQENENLLVAEMVNVSVQGVLFRLDRPLSVGSLISIEIKDSEVLRNNVLKAEVLRCDSRANVFPLQYYVAAILVEENDEYLVDSLALVYEKKEQNLNS